MEKNKKIEELINKLKNPNYIDILDKSILGDTENAFKNYLENYQRLESEDKILTIGIVGQVNAGKSSFLNALFFDSKDILPKAATPMTAALTKIRYSDNISAKVHFFSLNDWKIIEDSAKKCQTEIEKIKENLEKRGKSASTINDIQLLDSIGLSDSEKSFYEIYDNFKKNKSELRNKLEESENNDNFEELQGIDTIDSLKNKLEDYVGADGKYMPIVKYVEIFLNIDAIKDFDIVDTPGLNDPVISRGQLTRNFLGKCDVVFLLSPSGQFFDSQDISLFSEQLPQEGIKEVVVIGSKFDNGIIGESKKYNGDIKVAKEGVKNVLNEQFKARIQDSYRKDIFEKAYPPHYISSVCYDIYKHYDNLSEDEEYYKNNIKRAFSKFIDSAENFKELSGMEIFNDEIIPDIKSKKEKIFEERKKEIYSGFEDKFKKLMEELHEEVKRKQEELSSGDIKYLEEKVEEQENLLKELENEIKDSFNELTYEIQSKFNDLKLKFKKDINELRYIKEARVESKEWYDGISRFFGWLFNKEWGYVKTILIQDVMEKINNIILKCQEELNETCKNIFDIEYFTKDLVRKLSDVFEGKNFNKNDILYPLKKVLRNMAVSPVDLKDNYNDFLTKEFSGKDNAPAEEIKKLIEVKIIPEILDNITKDLDKQINKLTEGLEKQENNLIKDTSSSIKTDAEEMKRQLKDKKKYEELYKEAISNIEDIRNNIN